jgi:hypothetical protein
LGVQDRPQAPGNEFVPVALPQRFGLLTHPAILASTSHGDRHAPILRGVKVLRSFLCQDIPSPPPQVNVTLQRLPAEKAITTRDHIEKTHSSQALCMGCHSVIEGAGFAFEHYDALGRYVERERGLPLNSSGTVRVGGRLHSVDGAVQMAGLLAENDDVRRCFSKHLFQYTYGQPGKSRAGRCEIEAIAQRWRDSNGDLKAILETLVTSRAFRYRTASATTHQLAPQAAR